MIKKLRVDPFKVKAFSMILFKRAVLYIGISCILVVLFAKSNIYTRDGLYLLIIPAVAIFISFFVIALRESRLRTLVVDINPDAIQSDGEYMGSPKIEFKDAQLVSVKEGFYVIPKGRLSLILFYCFSRTGIRIVFVPNMLHEYEALRIYVESRIKLRPEKGSSEKTSK